MDIKKYNLTPGKDVNVVGAVSRFVNGAPRWAAGQFPEFIKVAADRSIEAAWPSLLQAGRELRGKPVRSSGWTVASADTGNPWQVAVSATAPEGWGFLYVLDLRVRTPDTKLAELVPEFNEERLRAEMTAKKMDARAIKNQLMLDRIFASIKADEIVAKKGITEGMPSPDTVNEINSVKVCTFKSPEGLGAPGLDTWASGLSATLTSVGKREYVSGMVVTTTPDGIDLDSDSSRKSTVSVQMGHCVGALEAMRVLRNALGMAGKLNDVEKRGKLVAARVHESLSPEDWSRALDEAAQGTVANDNGIAGSNTLAVCAKLWHGSVARTISDNMSNLRQCLADLEKFDYRTERTKYDCNDGRTNMWLRRAGDLSLSLMQSQNGTYAAVVEKAPDDSKTIVNFARVGGPDAKDEDVKILSAKLGFPKEQSRGSYAVFPDGRAEVLTAPEFSDRAIRDISDITSMIESVACCIVEDHAARSPQP